MDCCVELSRTAIKNSQCNSGDQTLYTINCDTSYEEIRTGTGGRRASDKGLLVFRGGGHA